MPIHGRISTTIQPKLKQAFSPQNKMTIDSTYEPFEKINPKSRHVIRNAERRVASIGDTGGSSQ
jgi:hypothetical protein